LTPTPDGGMRVDPVPFPGGRPGYTWGYDGTGPSVLYCALVGCATGDLAASAHHNRWPMFFEHGDRSSQLWNYIKKQDGAFRLPWPQVVAWANQDREKITTARAKASKRR